MIDWVWFVAGGIVLFGFILFFVLSMRRGYKTREPAELPQIKKRADVIKHYEKMRDGLTVRQEATNITANWIGTMGSIIGSIVVLFLGWQVSVVASVDCINGELSGSVSSVMSIVVPLFAIVVVGTIVLDMIKMFK